MEQQKQQPQELAEKKTVYMVSGQEVTLTRSIVRAYLTKGNDAVTDQEVVAFISLCQFQALNPFLNEAYMVKFKGSPAQIIVSKEALMKRAEQNEHYKGLEAGLILLRDGKVVEEEGSFYLDTDTLVGAWAKVMRDDKCPSVAKVNLKEYDKGQSIWLTKKATMIRKVAIVQALREAFPSQLNACYTMEESMGVDDQTPIEEIKSETELTMEEKKEQMRESNVEQPTLL